MIQKLLKLRQRAQIFVELDVADRIAAAVERNKRRIAFYESEITELQNDVSSLTEETKAQRVELKKLRATKVWHIWLGCLSISLKFIADVLVPLTGK